MVNLLLVAAGGAIGAAARYGVSIAAVRWLGTVWPYGTFAINVVGSLLIGLLAGWLAFRGDGVIQWKLFLGTGVLGGFTTFSAYSLETIAMIERKEYLPAAAYALGSVVAGVVAVFIGLWLMRRLLS